MLKKRKLQVTTVAFKESAFISECDQDSPPPHVYACMCVWQGEIIISRTPWRKIEKA